MEHEMELDDSFRPKAKEIAEEFANQRLAERVGHLRETLAALVRVHVFSKPNVYNGFAIISRHRSDLVTPIFAAVCVRLPAFVDFSGAMALDMALDDKCSS
jgi:hypothetical protein